MIHTHLLYTLELHYVGMCLYIVFADYENSDESPDDVLYIALQTGRQPAAQGLKTAVHMATANNNDSQDIFMALSIYSFPKQHDLNNQKKSRYTYMAGETGHKKVPSFLLTSPSQNEK